MSITRADYIAWLATMRSPETKQCFGTYYGSGGSVCAIGASPSQSGCPIASGPGVTASAFVKIRDWNDDDQLPLPVIADKIEELVAAGEIEVIA